MVGCMCEEYWELTISHQYHDERGFNVYSLKYIIYCDHMSSRRQILYEAPFLSSEEYKRLESDPEFFERTVEVVKRITGLGERARELIKFGRVVIERYPCPYCDC